MGVEERDIVCFLKIPRQLTSPWKKTCSVEEACSNSRARIAEWTVMESVEDWCFIDEPGLQKGLTQVAILNIRSWLISQNEREGK